MNTYQCACGNRLFFDNTICVSCGRRVGWCEACQSVAPLEGTGNPADIAESTDPKTAADTTPVEDRGIIYRCGNPACHTMVVKCRNYVVEHVCNRVFTSESANESELCNACELTKVIPDLTVAGNRERWAKLELAKRRLLCQLDELGLHYRPNDVGSEVPLSFEFKASTPDEQVFTSHDDGLIIINIVEADTVERERVRKQMHEPHRTLIGHMRHEVGHYYWMTLVEGKCEAECNAVFGNYQNPSYEDALKTYYANGPAADWQKRYVSEYATSHPWEDFAETWGFYLDMWAVITTMHHHLPALSTNPLVLPLATLADNYQQLGVFFNEVNRSMGLKDLVPEVISPEVVNKLEFIDRLVGRNHAVP